MFVKLPHKFLDLVIQILGGEDYFQCLRLDGAQLINPLLYSSPYEEGESPPTRRRTVVVLDRSYGHGPI